MGFHFAAGLSMLALAVSPNIAAAQAITGYIPPYGPHSTLSAADRANAKSALPLVTSQQIPRAAMLQHNTLAPGTISGVAVGSAGFGLGPKIVPYAYGTSSPQSIAPYTTARSSADVLGDTPTAAAVGVTSYPWRAAGKLYFTENNAPFICSASLIRPGVVVTAAHCVALFGSNSLYANWQFVPGMYDSGVAAPYGTWTAAAIYLATSYYNGTDTCYQSGVSCNNDIAVIVLNRQNGALPTVGWYSYGWNGYSYIASFGGVSLVHLTQLGYPLLFDDGVKQERTDGIGSYWTPIANFQNTLLGSAQTGGASGGPWLVNFGAVPVVQAGASLGAAATPDVVVGVTSWGSKTVGVNTVGSSYFGQNIEFPEAAYLDNRNVNRGAGNIGALVARACSFAFDNC